MPKPTTQQPTAVKHLPQFPGVSWQDHAIGPRLSMNPFWPIAIVRQYQVCHAAYLAYIEADHHAAYYPPDSPWRQVADQAYNLWSAAEAAAEPLLVEYERLRDRSRQVARELGEDPQHE